MNDFPSETMWFNVLSLMILNPAQGMLPHTLGDHSYFKRPTFTCKSGIHVKPMGEDSLLPQSELKAHSFLLDRNLRWVRGIVPYEIDPVFSERQVAKIKDSMQMFSDASCVKWIPHYNQKDYVRIVHVDDRETCSSVLGRTGGLQELYLGEECFNENGFQGAIVHEMMHAIGFIHEQQRIDRDCYVEVAQKAIEDQSVNFVITPDTDTGFPYDFQSIMHYGETWKMSGRNGEQLGNFEGKFTELDKMKLNNMYCGGPTFCQQRPVGCGAYRRAQKMCQLSFS